MNKLQIKDRVAVFHVMHSDFPEDKKRLYIHASVPYISTIEHALYPYMRGTIDSKYFENITKVISSIQYEFSTTTPKTSEKIDVTNFNSVKSPQKDPMKKPYQKSLFKHAKTITEQLSSLDEIFDFLFSLENEVDLLQIFTDDYSIPWDWIYDKTRDKLLCEIYGIGVTLHEKNKLKKTLHHGKHIHLTKEELRSSKCSALIVGNSYCSSEVYSMVKMETSIRNIEQMVKGSFGDTSTDAPININLQYLKDELAKGADDLHLIYLSGHFHKDGYQLNDMNYFSEINLQHALQESYFSSHPIVFLNGCASLHTGQDILATCIDSSHALAKTFLDLGAVACIVTSMEVRLQYAVEFAESFFSYLLTPGMPIGYAIKLARQKLDHLKSFEWATYHLFGDPTYVLIKSDV
jgi:hypothetical protein